LGTADVAATNDLDMVDDRRIKREDALDASPNEILRTVKLEPTPLLARAMHTPSKFWTRVRSPSITLTPTRSVSPGRNSGTGLSLVSASIASRSRVSIRFIGLLPSYFVAARQRAVPAMRPRGARSGPAALAVYR